MSLSQFPRSMSDKPVTYTVTQLPEVEGTLGIFSVLKSDPPTNYTVMVTNQGVTCDCPDYDEWARRRGVKNYACKHILKVHDFVISKRKGGKK